VTLNYFLVGAPRFLADLLEAELISRNLNFQKISNASVPAPVPLPLAIAIAPTANNRNDEEIYLVTAPNDGLNSISLIWAQWIGPKAVVTSFTSISQAAKILKAQGKLWVNLSKMSTGKAKLISELLLSPKKKALKPFAPLPEGPLGVWLLLSNETLVYSSAISPSLAPPEQFKFEETKIPPSRAYLKLWELLTRFPNLTPKPNDRVLELGSAPGGWTWVLGYQLKTQLTCVDRGEMDLEILKLSKAEWIKKDAFSWIENQVGSTLPYDWVFSDMACEPQKLLELVKKIISNNPKCKLICTIKLNDRVNLEILDQFKAILHSNLIHLECNKHELTWWLI